jgi:hypothetical protein
LQIYIGIVHGYVLLTTVASTEEILESITALHLCYNQGDACGPQGI